MNSFTRTKQNRPFCDSHDIFEVFNLCEGFWNDFNWPSARTAQPMKLALSAAVIVIVPAIRVVTRTERIREASGDIRTIAASGRPRRSEGKRA
jgi:hypothetical protein